ncbi:MAG: hypothetical protein JXR76_32610 [Deltaproteobacteria bacterium]|nr:hypothetical protein [Deltaproteobacteria bacterium]
MVASIHPFSAMRWFNRVGLFIAVLGAWACSGSSSAPAQDLHVVSFSPKDVVLDNREQIQLKFDKPVVSEDAVGKPVQDVPVALSPKETVAARWLDRQTLSLRPKTSWQRSTRYEVSLKKALAARVPPKEQKFSFVHDPLRFSGIVGIDTKMAPSDPRFALRFTQPVTGAAVEASCALYRKKNDDKMLLVQKGDKKPDTLIAVAPLHPLLQGETYEIRCQKLSPAKGNWLLEEATAEFTTFPRFEVARTMPNKKEIPPEAGLVRIEFSTPVARSVFEKHVDVRVNGKRLSNSHWDRSKSGKVYKWDSYLEAVSQYDIQINKGLADQFMQTLEAGKRVRFTTTDAPPAISSETGIVTQESQMDGYPLWTRNVSNLGIDCAQIPARLIAKVLGSGNLNLHPWIGQEDNDIKWKELQLRPKSEQLQLSETKNRWAEQRISLPQLCGNGSTSGIFLAEFTSDDVRAQKEKQSWGAYPYRVLASVTDLAVMLKVGPASGLVWVTSMSSGDTVAGATVSIYSLDGKRRFSGRTDADGKVTIPGSAVLEKPGDDLSEYNDYYSSQRFIAVVEKAGDTAVVDGDWNSGITLWNFSVTSDRYPRTTRIRGFIQSDRGIYRPGETVYFKALVREVSLNGPPVIPKDNAEITVTDSWGTPILEKKMALSRFGSVDFKVALGSAARLGDYYAKIAIAGQTFRERFSVEEFRPVAFEIKKTSVPDDVLVGEKLKFAFSADYLFGAPVKNANVEWDVGRRNRYVAFPKYRGYSFGEGEDDYWGWYFDDMYEEENNHKEFVSDGATTTDSKGGFSFQLRDSQKNVKSQVDYIARASVTDETDQQVTKTVVVRGHPTDVYLGVKASSWIQDVKDPLGVDVVALSKSGTPVMHDAKISLERYRWDCSSSPDRGYRCDRFDEKLDSKEVSIEAGGSHFDFPVKKPGDYTIRVSGKDSRGKNVVSTTWVWVTGRDYFWWGGEDSHRMTLVPSKEKYAPGQTAVVIPKANTEGGKLLVTVERSGIIESFITDGVAAGEGINIPIKDNYSPNVFVSIASVTPRKGDTDAERPTFFMGVINLDISTENRALKVNIETDKTEYEPGEMVHGKIRLTANGQPVVGEVAVSVADEGVLQVINYKTPNPLTTIYAPFGLGVDTSTNLINLLRYKSPVDEAEEGADGGEEAGPRVRSRFVASAYWKPDLVTDENGEAAFEFEAPDNLTAFRVMAVAADDVDKFGSSDRRIVINKKLLLQPVLPRFFGSGDTVKMGAMVHNYSKVSGEVKVNWELTGLWTRGSGETITLKSGESKRIQFAAKVGKQKQASVQMSAQMLTDKGEFDDAFKMTLPVRRNLLVERSTLFDGKTEDTGDVALSWPDDLVAGQSNIGVSVDRYGLGMLGESLRYLVQYPYGCLEQTLSRLLPMFKVTDLATSMKLDELKGTPLKKYISFGVDKVLKHQHDDGQFSLWPGSTPQPHLTAYALWGLSEAQKAGVRVDKNALSRGANALANWAATTGEAQRPGEAAEQAMAAFVLAHYNKADMGLISRLFESRAQLPLYGKAFLLRAILAANADRALAQTLVDEILGAAVADNDTLSIHETDQYSWYWSSDTRTTAMAISALLEFDAQLPEIPKLVDGLKNMRVGSGRWGNTQENVYALIAISDFVRAQEGGEAKVTITLNGKKWQEVNVKGSRIVRFVRKLKNTQKGVLRVQSDTPMNVFVNMALSRESDGASAVNKGFEVKRSYTDLETGKPVSKVKAGTLVRVRIEGNTSLARDYVAVADNIPAGFEAINTRLATEDASLRRNTSSNFGWDYVELRDDQVQAFMNRMQPGAFVVEYLMRATIPGTFASPGTLAEEMYTPSHYGLSAENTVVVFR